MPSVGRLPEPVVRQIAAGELETVSIDPPNDAGASGPEFTSEIPNLKSQISEIKSSESGPHSPPAAVPAPEAPPGLGNGAAAGPDLLQAADASMHGKLTRRNQDGRSEGIRYGGGSPQSEEAVERAIRWLVAHQRPDGSWSFNHIGEACQHYCTHPGSEPSTTAATGMALLPLLGAGYTHKKGEYQDVVQRGLDYLKKRGILISYGNDLRDGSSMYGQALATIALCEAYGMTRDEDLQMPAQRALDYIAYAQDLKSGGWRYNPGEPGDTTVTGWMIMALKSGQMAKLSVQSPAIFARTAVFGQRAEQRRLAVRLSRPQAGPGHLGRRSALPHVHRLAANERGAHQGRCSTRQMGTIKRQHLLRLLRHTGAFPLCRAGVGRLEPQDAQTLDQEPGYRGPRGGELVF